MTNKKLIENMINILTDNISNGPFIIDVPKAMMFVLYFNIYKKNNGMGGMDRKNGLTLLLINSMKLNKFEVNDIVDTRNLFAHIFDNKNPDCKFEIEYSIDCYPYEKDKTLNNSELKILNCLQALNKAYIFA